MMQQGEHVLAIPRSFIALTGDASTALFLSQLVYWSGRCKDPGRWVYKSHADWKAELGLGRCAVDRARRRLVELGIVEQKCRMVNGRRTMHFRIDRDALERAVARRDTTAGAASRCASPTTGRNDASAQAGVSKIDRPDCLLPTDRCAGNQQTSPWESSNPGYRLRRRVLQRLNQGAATAQKGDIGAALHLMTHATASRVKNRGPDPVRLPRPPTAAAHGRAATRPYVNCAAMGQRRGTAPAVPCSPTTPRRPRFIVAPGGMPGGNVGAPCMRPWEW